MQNYLKLALPLMVVTGVLTLGINALLGLVLTINMFDPTATLPLTYFEFLHLPALALILPIMAACVLVPICLRLAMNGSVTMPTFVLAEPDAHPKPVMALVETKAEVTKEASNHHLPVAA